MIVGVVFAARIMKLSHTADDDDGEGEEYYVDPTHITYEEAALFAFRASSSIRSSTGINCRHAKHSTFARSSSI
jgi:hypothetical protein